MVNIAIIEDDPIWINLMTGFLNQEEDFNVVATAATKDEAIGLTKLNLNIHVMLMDINLTDNSLDGINASLYIHETTDIKVVMLTAYSDKELITNAFSAGASNYVSKENYKDIPTAIRNALQDNSPFDIILNEYRFMKESLLTSSLTPSEQIVLSLAREGLSRSQIQEKLYKTENTLKTQVTSIIRKLGAKSLGEAILNLKRLGIKYDK